MRTTPARRRDPFAPRGPLRASTVTAALAVVACISAISVSPAGASARGKTVESKCVKQVPANGRDARGVAPRSPNPLAGLPFYVDPAEASAVDHRSYLASGQTDKAKQVAKLALAPKFRWFGRWSSMRQVANHLAAAQCAGKVAQMVTLRHQGKACNPTYQGGAPPRTG